MAGNGNSGAPGCPKTPEHRDAIRAALRRYWESPEGLAEREARKAAWRRARIDRDRRRIGK